MKASIEDVETILGEAVIIADSEGGRWVGTPFFIVRDDGPSRPATPAGVDKIVDFSDRVPLGRRTIDGYAVLLELVGGIARVYERPDGEIVYLNDDYCKAIERLLTDDEYDEFGERQPPPFFSWWQQPGPLSPVGVTTAEHPASIILAVIMPVRPR